jgi:MFS family permease
MLESRLPDPVVRNYYLYKAASSAYLVGPVWVLFLLSRDLSYAQIGLLDAVYGAALLLGEIPTGYVGDRIGRRNSLLLGTVLGSVGSFGFAFGHSVGVFAVLYAVLAIGRTFESGTESAWLYDVLQRRTDEEEFTRIRGRGTAVGSVTGAVGMLAGGALGEVDLALPWLVSGVATSFAFLVLLRFPEAEYDDDTEESFGVGDALSAVRTGLLGRSLRSFVVFTALFYAVVDGVNYFVQPVSRGFGVEVYQLGILYAAFASVSAVVSYRSEAIRSRVGVGGWFLVAPVGVATAFVAVGGVPLLALPTFFVMKAVRDVSRPLEHQYLNDNVASAGRATVLSAASMVQAVVAIPAPVAAGLLADRFDPVTAIAVLGGALFLVTGATWAIESPVVDRSGEAEPAD